MPGARCLVQYVTDDGDTVRRVVHFQDGDNRVARSMEMFGLQAGSFALETFDVDFREYVRVNDSDILETGCKLVLVKAANVTHAVKSPASTDDNVSTASTVPVFHLHSSPLTGELSMTLPQLQHGLSTR